MADEDVEDEGQKKKSPLMMIIVIVLVVILLVAGAVFGTLFFTGFFDKQSGEKAAEEKVAELEKAAADAKDPTKQALPEAVTKKTPEAEKFVYTYKEMERELLANLDNSRKVMQLQVAFMTHYDERVVKNIEKHDFAIRSAVLDIMRQTKEEELAKPTFRKDLAERIRLEVNALLEQYENFGGIEGVYFTSFVVQ
jgi:flagellar FliL protein